MCAQKCRIRYCLKEIRLLLDLLLFLLQNIVFQFAPEELIQSEPDCPGRSRIGKNVPRPGRIISGTMKQKTKHSALLGLSSSKLCFN